MASWEGALSEVRRVLAPGGHLLILDFSLPDPPLRWVYRPYLHYILPSLAALLTGEAAAYEYLGDSIETFPMGAAMCSLIENCGFQHATSERLSAGIVTVYAAECP
jgi:demethylmenaquinone methyltransferase/2-methoxy-6-polyprenyl-1,4-benzoquinol methylase